MSRAVLVTGAAGGIGRALTEALLARGDRVLATDVRAAALEDLAAPAAGALVTRALDVRDPLAWQEAVEAAVAAFGRLDVLFNVAGYLRPGRLHELAVADIDRHLDINVKGVIHGTRAAALAMLPRRAGHIVNIGSMASLTPVPGLNLYAASKFAVRGFSLSVAGELAPHGIAVTVVCPDAVETPMLDLQRGHAESALVFSGGRPLRAAEVVAALLGPVLEERPLELALPWGRGALAKLGSAFPGLAARIRPLLEARGRRRQGT